jgi:quinol monooxygenase YgiN
LPASTLHIVIRPGFEAGALDILSGIENRIQQYAGCQQFTWFQYDEDPYRFTLVERWESQERRDASLLEFSELWAELGTALAQESQPVGLRPVEALTGAPAPSEVREFVTGWFDSITRAAPVEELLARLTPHGLDMAFPEARLRSADDVRNWYADVNAAFQDHEHDLERLDVSWDAEAAVTDLDLAVIWKATSRADGSRFAFRGLQSWRIRRSFTTGRLEIVQYLVRSLDQLT